MPAEKIPLCKLGQAGSRQLPLLLQTTNYTTLTATSSNPVKAGKRISWRLIVRERRKKRNRCRLKKPWPNEPDPNVKVACTIPLDGEVHANHGGKGHRRVEKQAN